MGKIKRYEIWFNPRESIIVTASCPSVALVKAREEYHLRYFWDIREYKGGY